MEITEQLAIATWNIGGAEMIKVEQVLHFMEHYHIDVFIVTEAKRWTQEFTSYLEIKG